MKNNSFEEIWVELEKANKILIPLHPNPDGDSFGSAVAMKYVLEKRGKKVLVISQDNLSENLSSFEFHKDVEFGKKFEDLNLKDFDTLVFLDHGTLQWYSENIRSKNLLKEIDVINIDHHESNEYYGSLNYVDSSKISCCSILFEFFEKIGIDFNGKLSRSLLLGICTDSAFFVHGNVLDSMKKAIVLIDRGHIDYKNEFVNRITTKPWNVKKMEGSLLKNMERKKIQGKEVIYTFITKEDIKKYELSPTDLRLGIIFLQSIKDYDLIFSLSEKEDKIKGSFRSIKIDTTKFSEKMNGGGHKEASGFELEKMRLDKAMQKVFDVIKKVGFHKIG